MANNEPKRYRLIIQDMSGNPHLDIDFTSRTPNLQEDVLGMFELWNEAMKESQELDTEASEHYMEVVTDEAI